MLSRRNVLAVTGAVLFAEPVLAALPDGTDALAFQISRNGSRIGTHTLHFQKMADGLSVNVAVEMVVRFGPIPVFRYNHNTIERWQAGQFVSLDSKTDYDGEPGFSAVRREGSDLVVEGSKVARYIAPADALPATHWNRAELSRPMINPENGTLLTPQISDRGMDGVQLASGTRILAHRYAWRGKDTLDLWYDDKDVWAGLTAVAGDGSQLVYARL